MENTVKGYKVFNEDWTCRGKQYTCPGMFEEPEEPVMCEHGMHFCKRLIDCFIYYGFDCKNKVAEVIAHGTVIDNENICCTNKLEIVREVPWHEVLELVNTGYGNTGNRNTGNGSTGNRNTGNKNTGNSNTGSSNTGDCNTGDCNDGNCNTGNGNTGDCNTGYGNTGNFNCGNGNTGIFNTGNFNTGSFNTGNFNTGNKNTGNFNTGDFNTGYGNTGDCNTGDCNTGDFNTGDFNTTVHSTGCFNTEEGNISMFNKLSTWTYAKWNASRAKGVLASCPSDKLICVSTSEMTCDEKTEHPEAETTGGYIKKIVVTNNDKQEWWNALRKSDKEQVMSLPNFDAEIFKEITGIDVTQKED